MNNVINPLTGKVYTYNEFYLRARDLNDHPGSKISVVQKIGNGARNDTGVNNSDAKSVCAYINSLYTKYSPFQKDVINTIVFDEQGTGKRGRINQILEEGNSEDENGERHIKTYDKAEHLLSRIDENAEKLIKENNDTNILTIRKSKHGTISIFNLYKMMRLHGCEEILLDFINTLKRGDYANINIDSSPYDWQSWVRSKISDYSRLKKIPKEQKQLARLLEAQMSVYDNIQVTLYQKYVEKVNKGTKAKPTCVTYESYKSKYDEHCHETEAA